MTSNHDSNPGGRVPPTTHTHMDQDTINELNRRSGAVCDAEDVLDAIQELQSRVDIEHEEELWNMVSDVKHDMRIVMGIL